MSQLIVSAKDKKFLTLALNLARRSVGLTGKNPSVGCVITCGEIIIGRGNTQIGGRPHAEFIAIEQALKHYLYIERKSSEKISVYVTLEPCAHETTTPSCAQEIVTFGADRVIYLTSDPDFRTNGKGRDIIEKAGIECIRAEIYENENSDVLKGYIKQKKTGLPYVTLKIGSSLNGKISTKNGESKWITNELSRKRVHLLRSENDGIMIGKNSMITDNPRLNLRHGFEVIQNKPIFILDTNLELSDFETLSVFEKIGKDKVYIMTSRNPKNVSTKKSNFLIKNNVEKVDKKGRFLNLKEVLKVISQLGVNRLLVEGGASVWTSFLEANLFDEIIMFTGNKIMNNSSVSCFNDFLPDNKRLEDFPNLTLISCQKWKDNIETKWIASS